MKVKYAFKFTTEIEQENEFMKYVSLFRESIRQDLKKKSMKCLGGVIVNVGHDACDFINNKLTAVFNLNAFKVPRILNR